MLLMTVSEATVEIALHENAAKKFPRSRARDANTV